MEWSDTNGNHGGANRSYDVKSGPHAVPSVSRKSNNLTSSIPAWCSPVPQLPYRRSTGKQHTRPQQNGLAADLGALLARGTVPD